MQLRASVCRLPSFTEAFTASVPLTRIRDIAHRNDIPGDLKQEIKHTIQVSKPPPLTPPPPPRRSPDEVSGSTSAFCMLW